MTVWALFVWLLFSPLAWAAGNPECERLALEKPDFHHLLPGIDFYGRAGTNFKPGADAGAVLEGSSGTVQIHPQQNISSVAASLDAAIPGSGVQMGLTFERPIRLGLHGEHVSPELYGFELILNVRSEDALRVEMVVGTRETAVLSGRLGREIELTYDLGPVTSRPTFYGVRFADFRATDRSLGRPLELAPGDGEPPRFSALSSVTSIGFRVYRPGETESGGNNPPAEFQFELLGGKIKVIEIPTVASLLAPRQGGTSSLATLLDRMSYRIHLPIRVRDPLPQHPIFSRAEVVDLYYGYSPFRFEGEQSIEASSQEILATLRIAGIPVEIPANAPAQIPLPAAAAVWIWERVLENMSNAENQVWASGTILRGEVAISEALEAVGFRVSVVEFSREVEMRELMRSLSAFAIPTEAQAFGTAHGSFTHHAQILAATRGFSRAELNLFRLALYEFVTNRGQWDLWNVLFDSRDSRSPNGVGFWRDRLSPQ